MSITYGWAIDLSVTNTNSGNNYLISINLSMPGGNTTPDWLRDRPLLDTESRFEAWSESNWSELNKAIFTPWNWELKSWLLVGKDIKGNKVLIPLSLNTPKTGPDYLKNEINKNLEQLPILSDKFPDKKWIPFDVENVEKGRTLVHALGPLAYLPAKVSNELKMTFTFEVDIKDCVALVAFPNFQINGNEFKVTPDNIEIKDVDSYVSYKYTDEVQFYCSVEKNISLSHSWETVPITEITLNNQTQVKINLLNYLTPISIWKQLVNQLIAENLALENIELIYNYLIRSIGAGWDFSFEDKKLGKQSQCVYRNLLETFTNDNLSIKVDLVDKPKFNTNVDDFVGFDFDENLKDFKSFLISWKDKKYQEFCNLLPNVLNLLNDSKTFNQISIVLWLIQNQSYITPNADINLFNQIRIQEVLQTVIDKALYASIFEPIWLDKNEEVLKLLDTATYTKLEKKDLNSIKTHLISGCESSTLTVTSEISAKIEELIKSQIETFSKVTYDVKPQQVPYDSGLHLKFKPIIDNDESFRGYAIGLGVSNDNKNWQRSAWITDVQLLLNNETKYRTEFLHETIGATQSNSQTVGNFEFTGNPILASRWFENADKPFDFVNNPAIPDADEMGYIDYVWPEQDYQANFPLLGYGLWYRGIAVSLGNAGEIFDHKISVDKDVTKLIPALDAIKYSEKSLTSIQYLSQVAPGAPSLVNAYELIALQELSSETKAYAFQAQDIKTQKDKALPIQPVALLTNGSNIFITPKSDIDLHILPPVPNADFLEKWLNADVINNNSNSQEAIEKLNSFKNNLKNANEIKAKFQSLYKTNLLADQADIDLINLQGYYKALSIHPAVEKILIKVYFNGDDSEPEKIIDIGGKNYPIKIKVNQEEKNNFEHENNDPKKQLIIKIMNGSFCKVEFYSAVPEKYFIDDREKRFNSVVFNDIIKSSDGGHWLFGPTEYWFEAVPKYDNEYEVPDFKVEVEYENKKPFVELSLAQNIEATWIRGVEFERHEWHWTGYPVTFPKANYEFNNWLSSFVGVESYRNEDNYILNTYIDNANIWKIGDDPNNKRVVVRQHQLPSGSRPAKYIAFSVRPKIRFSKWIKSDADIRKKIESKVFANGVLAKGVPIDVLQERIPVPPLKWAIPLTATYTAPKNNENAQLPERTQNGNLLIFDEAFRRTDSLVRFGGIGDTIDIEVVGTRTKDIHEFGVNPIFNGYERLNNQMLVCDEPFGLTYDFTRNAKVTQTGVVVRPQLPNGKWMLAKVRARRLIHPDTTDSKELESIGDRNYKLPLRKIGDQVIPVDFYVNSKMETLNILAIDTLIDKQHSDSLFFSFSNLRKAIIQEAEVGGTKIVTKYSLEMSIVSEQESATLSGTLVRKHKQNVKFENIEEAVYLSNLSYICINFKDEIIQTPRLLQTSDYTDPIWLSFIGSFGVDAKLIKPDECSIKKVEEALEFDSKIVGLISHFKTPSDDSACFQALMVYEPVQDIYKTGKELDGGRFVGFYVYESKSGTAAKFVQTADTQNASINSLNEPYAYLISIQKATATEQVEKSESHLVDFFKSEEISKMKLMDLLFLEQKESKIRITPEYMGPIRVTK